MTYLNNTTKSLNNVMNYGISHILGLFDKGRLYGKGY
jgi:hypothetical protein